MTYRFHPDSSRHHRGAGGVPPPPQPVPPAGRAPCPPVPCLCRALRRSPGTFVGLPSKGFMKQNRPGTLHPTLSLRGLRRPQLGASYRSGNHSRTSPNPGPRCPLVASDGDDGTPGRQLRGADPPALTPPLPAPPSSAPATQSLLIPSMGSSFVLQPHQDRIVTFLPR